MYSDICCNTNKFSLSLSRRTTERTEEKSSFASALRSSVTIYDYTSFSSELRAAAAFMLWQSIKTLHARETRQRRHDILSFCGRTKLADWSKIILCAWETIFSGVIVWLCKRDRKRAELKRVWREKEGGKEMSPEQCFSLGAGKCVFFSFLGVLNSHLYRAGRHNDKAKDQKGVFLSLFFSVRMYPPKRKRHSRQQTTDDDFIYLVSIFIVASAAEWAERGKLCVGGKNATQQKKNVCWPKLVLVVVLDILFLLGPRSPLFFV